MKGFLAFLLNYVKSWFILYPWTADFLWMRNLWMSSMTHEGHFSCAWGSPDVIHFLWVEEEVLMSSMTHRKLHGRRLWLWERKSRCHPWLMEGSFSCGWGFSRAHERLLHEEALMSSMTHGWRLFLCGRKFWCPPWLIEGFSGRLMTVQWLKPCTWCHPWLMEDSFFLWMTQSWSHPWLMDGDFSCAWRSSHVLHDSWKAYGCALVQWLKPCTIRIIMTFLTESFTYHCRQFLAAVSPVFQKSFYGSFGKLIIQQYFIIQ